MEYYYSISVWEYILHNCLNIDKVVKRLQDQEADTV